MQCMWKANSNLVGHNAMYVESKLKSSWTQCNVSNDDSLPPVLVQGKVHIVDESHTCAPTLCFILKSM